MLGFLASGRRGILWQFLALKCRFVGAGGTRLVYRMSLQTFLDIMLMGRLDKQCDVRFRGIFCVRVVICSGGERTAYAMHGFPKHR